MATNWHRKTCLCNVLSQQHLCLFSSFSKMNGNLSTLLINQNWFIDNISQKTNPIILNDWQFLIVTNEKNTSTTSISIKKINSKFSSFIIERLEIFLIIFKHIIEIINIICDY